MDEYKTETGEFKGNKTISIFNGEKRIVSFGLKKAKAILANIEDIKKFVNANDVDAVKVEDIVVTDQV